MAATTDFLDYTSLVGHHSHFSSVISCMNKYKNKDVLPLKIVKPAPQIKTSGYKFTYMRKLV
jgi:hypothetical protein